MSSMSQVRTYSPIKFLRMKNFRNIGDITINFDESPIVCLVGDNESGKTSIIKAFTVLALHAYQRDQKDFIRDGTKGFGIALGLHDETIITRIKGAGVNIYKVERAGKTIWETSKIDAGLPVEVQEIMGLLEEPETGEYLHVRTYEDKLLFIVTPSSTNYKVMYNALKVEYLTKAIRLGIKETNALKSKLDDNEKSIKTLLEEVRKIKIYDIEPVVNIKKRLQGQVVILEKLERAKELSENTRRIEGSLGALSLIDSAGVKEISPGEALRFRAVYNLLNSIGDIKRRLEVYNNLSNLRSVDDTIIRKILSVKAKMAELEGKKRVVHEFQNLSGLEEINVGVTEKLRRAVAIKNNIARIGKRVKVYDLTNVQDIDTKVLSIAEKFKKAAGYYNKALEVYSELKNIAASVEAIQKERDEMLRKLGVKAVECPKCNELIPLEGATILG